MVARRELADDRGAGTVLSLAVLAVVCFATALGFAKAQLILASRQAATAADLSALAGAQALRDPCGRAAAVAAANGTQLSGCTIAGGDVLVQVIRPMPPITASLLTSFHLPTPPVTATSRAGYPQSS